MASCSARRERRTRLSLPLLSTPDPLVLNNFVVLVRFRTTWPHCLLTSEPNACKIDNRTVDSVSYSMFNQSRDLEGQGRDYPKLVSADRTAPGCEDLCVSIRSIHRASRHRPPGPDGG